MSDVWKRGSRISRVSYSAIPHVLCLLLGALEKECLKSFNVVNKSKDVLHPASCKVLKEQSYWGQDL